MDAFQSVWYRLVLLFSAMYLTVFWFVLGPSSPGYAVSVVSGTFSLGPAVAYPVMRRVPRQWFRAYVRARTPTHRRRRNFRLAARCLRMESPCGRTYAEILGQKGRLTLHGAVCAKQCQRPRNLLWHLRTFAVLALFSRRLWSAALWMLLPGVVVHLYPVLLQRSIMLRLRPLLDNTGCY
jgi:hypothetical protein